MSTAQFSELTSGSSQATPAGPSSPGAAQRTRATKAQRVRERTPRPSHADTGRVRWGSLSWSRLGGHRWILSAPTGSGSRWDDYLAFVAPCAQLREVEVARGLRAFVNRASYAVAKWPRGCLWCGSQEPVIGGSSSFRFIAAGRALRRRRLTGPEPGVRRGGLLGRCCRQRRGRRDLSEPSASGRTDREAAAGLAGRAVGGAGARWNARWSPSRLGGEAGGWTRLFGCLHEHESDAGVLPAHLVCIEAAGWLIPRCD